MENKTRKLLFERMNSIGGMSIIKENESDIDDQLDAAEEINSDQDYMEEAPSYQIKLDKISEIASKLHEKLKIMDNLPSWVQDKITIAEHNMVAIHDYLEGEAHEEAYHDNVNPENFD